MKVTIEVLDTTQAVVFTYLYTKEDDIGMFLETKMLDTKDLEKFKNVESDM